MFSGLATYDRRAKCRKWKTAEWGRVPQPVGDRHAADCIGAGPARVYCRHGAGTEDNVGTGQLPGPGRSPRASLQGGGAPDPRWGIGKKGSDLVRPLSETAGCKPPSFKGR